MNQFAISSTSNEADKAFSNVTVGTIFGVTFDTINSLWWLPQDKRIRFLNDLVDIISSDRVVLKVLERVLGKITHFLTLFPQGRFFKTTLLSLVNSSEDKSVSVSISEDLRRDLAWFAHFVELNADGFPFPSLQSFPPSFSSLTHQMQLANLQTLQSLWTNVWHQ